MSTKMTTMCIPNHIVIEFSSTPACIPNKIVIEILLRIPAKTLYKRLRWVCKYWFHLITRDPNFAKMHMIHHSSHNNPCLLMRDPNGNLFKRYLNYTTYNASSDQESLDLPLKCIPKSMTMLSCNGLIFFHSISTLDDTHCFCIWNPCTREYRLLPDPQVIYRKETITCGFGYDRTIDNYKVIRNAACFRDDDSENRGTNVQVYTLGTNSWRNIGYTAYKFSLQGQNVVYLDGALYWIGRKINRIISFDIKNEKYQEVPNQPDLSNEKIFFLYAKLFVFEDSLCLYTTGSYCLLTSISYHMWVMKKDYVANNSNDIIESYSWTKLCLILKSFLQPLRFAKNGYDIVMMDGNYLMLLNRKNHRTTTLSKICEWKYHLIDVYTESLVSLNSGTYVSNPQEYKLGIKDKILKFFRLF